MKICFLSGLKNVTGREELELDYEGRLSSLLEMLCREYGQEFRWLVMDPDNPSERNPFLKILVDGSDIRKEDLELAGMETIFLFLPIAGG